MSKTSTHTYNLKQVKPRMESFQELMRFNLDAQFAKAEENIEKVNATQ